MSKPGGTRSPSQRALASGGVDAAQAGGVRDQAGGEVSTWRASSAPATSKERSPPIPGVAHDLDRRMALQPPCQLGRGLGLPPDALPRASRVRAGAGRTDPGAATMPERCGTPTGRSASSSRLQTTAPSSTSSWPPRYFVALCRTKSAPCSSGRRWIGVAAVGVDDDAGRMSGRGLEVRHREERIRRRLQPDEVDAVRAACPVWSNSTTRKSPALGAHGR